MADDDLTPRQRRAQQAKKSNKPKASTNLLTPTVIGWAIALLIIGGVGAGMWFQFSKEGSCPGHWHATSVIVVDGEKVPYNTYDLGNPLPMSYHLHTPDDQQWHFEPTRIECIGFETALNAVHTEISSNSITLSGERHTNSEFAGTYETNETHTIQAFHAVGWSDDWKPISISKLNDRQLLDGERVLILYGDYSDEEINQWQDQVDYPSGGGQQGQLDTEHPG